MIDVHYRIIIHTVDRPFSEQLWPSSTEKCPENRICSDKWHKAEHFTHNYFVVLKTINNNNKSSAKLS